ncbi:MAG: hypothetical protein U9Q90_00840 [Campylobacterota bacterium]|nr:hypothetical protein [Campylobacterota bacterium]
MQLLKTLFLTLAMMIWISPLLQAGTEYKYSYIPKKAYENQIFPITVLEIGSSPDSKPQFSFDQQSTIKPLFQNPLVVKNGNDSFYTFYFKAHSKVFNLPRLTIVDNNRSIDFEAGKIPVIKLKPREDFCGVLAADMKIKTSQASTYDGKNNLVNFSIEAFEANVENMHLKSVIEDGIENIDRKDAMVTAEYYAVLPESLKNLKFTYFNTIKQQYIYLQTPIEIKDASVATQSELNPKDDSFDKLKKSTFIGLSIFFFLLFLWRRDFFYLILAVVSITTLLTFYTPKKQVCVKQGAALYILPTHTSRISTKVNEEFKTPLLGERTDYYKIEYENGVIGWIKHEDLCED